MCSTTEETAADALWWNWENWRRPRSPHTTTHMRTKRHKTRVWTTAKICQRAAKGRKLTLLLLEIFFPQKYVRQCVNNCTSSPTSFSVDSSRDNVYFFSCRSWKMLFLTRLMNGRQDVRWAFFLSKMKYLLVLLLLFLLGQVGPDQTSERVIRGMFNEWFGKACASDNALSYDQIAPYILSTYGRHESTKLD